MTIHREGFKILFITLLGWFVVNVGLFYLIPDWELLRGLIAVFTLIVFFLFLQFFRHPHRSTPRNENHIICPADGKVVVIEKVMETEFLKDERIQISIFMSPLNVHLNRFPVGGKVEYQKYHPGLYLVAWDPKSSTENERNTVVVRTNNNISVLFRQIAGKVARRIRWYCKEGDVAVQGEEFGFIKFGSRVDVFLPTTAEINVELGQKVKGGETLLATFQ